jgi:hypothetical protein
VQSRHHSNISSSSLSHGSAAPFSRSIGASTGHYSSMSSYHGSSSAANGSYTSNSKPFATSHRG